MKPFIVKHTILNILIVTIVSIHHASASTDNSTSISTHSDLQRKTSTLSSLLNTMDEITDEITETQKLLGTPKGEGKELVLKNRIDLLSRKLITLEDNFEFLASEVNYHTTRDVSRSEFNWNRELKTLLGPLIRELQRLTMRPRQIEKLRSDIERYDNQLEVTQRAVSNLGQLMASPRCPDKLRARLDESARMWSSRQNDIETAKRIALLQLDNQAGGDTSISKSVQSIPNIFFKSHGRNICVSFLAFMLTALLMFKLHEFIRKYSPLHAEDRSFYGRLFDLSYIFIATIFSLMAAVGALYYFSDWVLLSLVLVFIIGVAWASKETFPRIWNQARLIMNFGPVREGEVIVHNGITYKMVSINIYSVIENPALDCGRLRLPIEDLLNYRSRPPAQDEPWFPSKTGDWVLLSDKSHGQIIAQTPETVKLKLLGGAVVSYTMQDYLSLTPMNLSSGFRLWVTFGLDYKHQAAITETLPELFKNQINTHLTTAGFSDSLSSVSVHFMTAAESSLNLEITSDFTGEAGKDYIVLERIINKACVDTCNANNLTIPFNQLTIHMSDH